MNWHLVLVWGGLIGGIALLAYAFWPKIKGMFGDSETLFAARIAYGLGIVLQALQLVDFPTLGNMLGLSPTGQKIMILAGAGMEIVRKMRTQGGLLTDDLTPKV